MLGEVVSDQSVEQLGLVAQMGSGEDDELAFPDGDGTFAGPFEV
ncbi:MAG: hypothetical protein JWN06_1346 [Propionibacteriaceae bacterium]|nr:hypothetical protein [Propionibacteriaceae bacterium]